MKDLVVLKLGGSKFAESEEIKFNFELAVELEQKLSPLTDKFQFIIILGGGYLARSYQKYLRKYNLSNRDLDWVGAAANSMNATIMRVALGAHAEESVLMNTEITNSDRISFEKSYKVVGGEKPGQTGDMVAVNMAIRSGSNSVIIMKDVDGVYTEDPRKNPAAKLITDLTWDEYHSNIVNSKSHEPGISIPVDPKASETAHSHGLSIKIVGDDLDNFVNAIRGNTFIGTTIHA